MGLLSGISSAISGFVSTISNAISGAISSISSAFSGLISSVVHTFNATSSDILSAISNTLAQSGFASSISNLFSGIAGITNIMSPQEIQQETVYLVTIAFYLAGLSYFLGALIYMIPLPFPTLKNWAPKMIKDAIYVTVWLSFYTYVLNAAQGFLSMFGTSWSDFICTINTEETGLFEIYLYIVGLFFLVSLPGIISSAWEVDFESVVGVIVWVVATILNIIIDITGIKQVLSALSTQSLQLFIGVIEISTFYILIYSAAPLLIVLGILLMALPFRMGRQAGSALIATTLVFYVGLPLMPVILSGFENLILGGDPQFYINMLQGLFIVPWVFVPSAGPILGMLRFELIDLPLVYIMFLGVFSFGLAEVIASTTGFDIIKVETHFSKKHSEKEEETEDETRKETKDEEKKTTKTTKVRKKPSP